MDSSFGLLRASLSIALVSREHSLGIMRIGTDSDAGSGKPLKSLKRVYASLLMVSIVQSDLVFNRHSLGITSTAHAL